MPVPSPSPKSFQGAPSEIRISESQLSTLADLIVSRLKTTEVYVHTIIPRRLTIREFAACTNYTPEVIRRRVRSKWIDRKLVEGRPSGIYRIDRMALVKFNVPYDVAAERLNSWKATQVECPIKPDVRV